MRVYIELHTREFATVHYAPTLVERLIGRRSHEHSAFSIRGRDGTRWVWLDGSRVDPSVERKLNAALRDSIVLRATAPPA